MAFLGLKCFLFLLLSTNGYTQLDPIPFDHEILQHVSLGYILKPIRAIQVYTETAHLYFHLAMPSNENKPSRLDCTNSTSICEQLQGTYDFLTEIRSKTYEMVQNAVVLSNGLTDCLQQQSRAKRYPTFLANIFSSLTGLSKSDDLNNLQASVKRLQNLTLNSVMASTSQRNQISSLARIQGDQMERLESLTQYAKRDLEHIQSIVNSQGVESDYIHALQFFMFKTLYRYTEGVHHFAVFQSALESLFSGKLTSFIIPLDALRVSLTNLQSHLDDNHEHLSVVTTDLTYYYREAQYVVFRKLNDLIIRINCPLSSLSSKFTVFQLIKLPLSLPTDPTHFSLLDTEVQTIAVGENHYITFTDDVRFLPHQIDLTESTFQIRTREIPTCETALLSGDSTAVIKECSYHVITAQEVPKLAVRLTTNKVYVSGIKKLWLTCNNKVNDLSNTVLNKQTVITHACNCEITADNMLIPAVTRSCNNISLELNSNTTQFPINYVFLAQLFADTDVLKGLDPNKLYPQTPEIKVPKLTLATNKYSEMIARSQNSKYQLAQIVNATKNGNSIFDTAGQLALQQILEFNPTSFDVTNTKDLFVGMSGCITILLVVSIIYLYFKMKSMSALILLLSHANPNNAQLGLASDSLKLQFTLPQTTTASTLTLNSFTDLTKLISLEQTVLVCIIIFIIVTITNAAYRHFQRSHLGAQSRAFLQVGSITENCTIPFIKLSCPHQFYIVKTIRKDNKVTASISYGAWFFSTDTLIISGLQLSVCNPALDLEILLSLNKKIPFLSTRKLARIIQKEHFLAFILTNKKGQIKTCVPIRTCAPATESFSPNNSQPPLYPQLNN